MFKKKLLILAIPLVVLVIVGCEGPKGSEGPIGPEGPQGPQGEVTIYVQTAIVASDETANVTFLGLQVESSVVNCWLSETSAGPWLHVGTDLDGPFCVAANSGSNLLVALFEGVAGYVFMATAVTGT